MASTDVEPAVGTSGEQETPEKGSPGQGREGSSPTFQESLPALQQAQGQHPLRGENPLPGTTTVPELTEAVKKITTEISNSLATIVSKSLSSLEDNPSLKNILLLSMLRSIALLAKHNNIEENRLLALMRQLYQEAPTPNA